MRGAWRAADEQANAQARGAGGSSARGAGVRQGIGRAGGHTGVRQGAQGRGRGARGGRLGAPVLT